MKIALVIGEMQGNKVKPKLQSVKDNLNIDVFENIPRFIDISLRRNSIYDRILLLSSKIDNKTLTDLHNYWGSTSKDTNVVLLCRKGADEELANAVMRTFVSTNVAVMLIESTTVQILAQAVLLDTREITQKYGISDYLDVEIDLDTYDEPVEEEPQEEVPPQPVVAPTAQAKKKGFFSGLFSGKSNKEKHEEAMRAKREAMSRQANQQNTQQTNQGVSEPPQPMIEPVYREAVHLNQESPAQDDFENSNNQVYGSEPEYTEEDTSLNGGYDVSEEENNFIEESEPISDSSGIDESETDDFIEDENEDDFGFSEANEEESSSLNQNNIVDEFEENLADTEDDSYNNHTEPSVVDDYADSSYTEPEQSTMVDDFAPDEPEIDIDFGTGVLATTSAYEGTEVEDDIDLGAVDLASAEEAYRQKVEQPKVITNTVVKEVVKNVGIGGGSILKSVYAGRLKKVIIVTGDRGTGVTTTALKLAYEFAKHTSVLYFDCDVDNHGLLNYIDYSQFRNYEPIHMQGVKLCRNAKSMNNCLVGYDTNLDLLTTDFSCDVTDEELEQAQGVVAERSNDYGVVVVDCPISKLHCISDLVLTGVSVVCVESSKRGFMNMLCRFESSPLQLRYKRSIVSKGLMFLTKCGKDVNVKKLVEYVKAIYQPDDVDYMSMSMKVFNGKLNDSLLNEVLEG